jgi:hypothetical protein
MLGRDCSAPYCQGSARLPSCRLSGNPWSRDTGRIAVRKRCSRRGIASAATESPAVARGVGNREPDARSHRESRWLPSAKWAVPGSNQRPPGCKPGALPTELTALEQAYRPGSSNTLGRPAAADGVAAAASTLHSGPPSTSGPGHSPFKAVARVRIPLGAFRPPCLCANPLFSWVRQVGEVGAARAVPPRSPSEVFRARPDSAGERL